MGSVEQESNDAVITDANVLIDYCKSDKKILTLFSEKICQIYVPTIILDEVVQLSEKEAEKIGLKLFEPTFEQVLEASEKGGFLSFQDKLCFIISRDKKWTCVTNDKNLRKKCKGNNLVLVKYKYMNTVRGYYDPFNRGKIFSKPKIR